MYLVNYELEFLRESNRIEGITRPVIDTEIAAYHKFMALDEVGVTDMCEFVAAIQPDAVLRNKKGLNVRVGNHVPRPGSKFIEKELQDILALSDILGEDDIQFKNEHSHKIHHMYETLHPFTDGNGRSGRMLWWWMMGGSQIGFLHRWYYQSLEFRK